MKVSVLTEQNQNMEKTIDELKRELEQSKEQAGNIEEVLEATKGAHEREQNLEDELSDLRNLLDNATKKKSVLKKGLQAKDEELGATKEEFQKRLSDLQSNIISMKEEKLELKTNLRKVEEMEKRTRRVLAVLQETSESEDSAPQIILDMKEHLREQQGVVCHLREICDEGNHIFVDKLSDGINISLCFLEAAVFGNAIVSPKSVSGIDHWNESSPIAILEAQKKIMRNEIKLEMKRERDQELLSLDSELAYLKRQNETHRVLNSELLLLKNKNKEYVDML